jgi:hypothetical protein
MEPSMFLDVPREREDESAGSPMRVTYCCIRREPTVIATS